jgi:hypothetical protein
MTPTRRWSQVAVLKQHIARNAQQKGGYTMASRKALVVAINDYPDSANDLPSCVEDAKGVTELLQSDTVRAL